MIDYKKLSQNDLNKALKDACETGDLELAKYLVSSDELKFHADISHNKWQAVKLATAAGHIEIVKHFLDDIQNHYPNIVWHVACQNGQVEILKHLFTTKEFQSEYAPIGYYGGLVASNAGKTNVLDYFLNSEEFAPFITNEKIMEFFYSACNSDHISALNYLVKLPKFIQYNNLHDAWHYGCLLASEAGKTNVLDYFLNSENFAPFIDNGKIIDFFIKGCSRNHINVLEYLAKLPKFIQNNSLNEACNKGMIHACDKNAIESMRYLIFNLKMNLDNDTKDHLIAAGRDDILNLFKIRELNENLSSNLNINKQPNKKIKI